MYSDDALSDNASENSDSELLTLADYAGAEEEVFLPSQIDVSYTSYNDHIAAHIAFRKNFIYNTFGHACAVCDRLWFKEDLHKPPAQCHDLLKTIIVHFLHYIILYFTLFTSYTILFFCCRILLTLKV